MNSPTAAFTWEIWRRHGKRLAVIVGVLLAFALFYPKLCAYMGLNAGGLDALDQIAETFSRQFESSTLLGRLLHIMTVLFLLLGPLACMMISLFYLVWVFTFVDFDAKKGFAFPARILALPVSTGFLATWLRAAGLVSVAAIYLGWTRLVGLPRVDVFDGYTNLLVWVVLLASVQAILWALDGLPFTRMLVLGGVVCFLAFLAGPAIQEHPFLHRNRTVIQLAILAMAFIAGYGGLGKIRHGCWQGWNWKWRSGSAARQAMAKPAFRSPAHAQLWFEWRRMGAKLFLTGCALSGAALLVMAVVAAWMGRLSEGDLDGLIIYLLAVPLFIHFLQGIAPERIIPPFLAVRPLTNGEVVMAKLKSTALSTVFSWIATAAMFCLVPLLGAMPAWSDQLPVPAQYQALLRPLLPLIALGAVFWTWRLVAANLCFGMAGKTWIASLPGLMPYAWLSLAGLIFYFHRQPGFEPALFRMLPFLLGGLVLVKLVLAQWAFRISLKRGLLSRAAMLQYLGMWLTLAGVFLIPTLAVFHRERWTLSLALGIILALPLARIGFAPIALRQLRHG